MGELLLYRSWRNIDLRKMSTSSLFIAKIIFVSIFRTRILYKREYATNSAFSSHDFQNISKLDFVTDAEVFIDALDNSVSNRLLNLCIDYQNKNEMRTGTFST